MNKLKLPVVDWLEVRAVSSSDYLSDGLSFSQNGMDPIYEDRLARELNFGPEGIESETKIPVDVIDREDQIVVYMDVPGLEYESLEIHIEDYVLMVKGETCIQFDSESDEILIQERDCGPFKRNIALPVKADSANLRSEFNNGVLEITILK
jgi:HSP20 family molecular chaperone IbpA